jgi:hypothetical protein
VACSAITSNGVLGPISHYLARLNLIFLLPKFKEVKRNFGLVEGIEWNMMVTFSRILADFKKCLLTWK